MLEPKLVRVDPDETPDSQDQDPKHVEAGHLRTAGRALSSASIVLGEGRPATSRDRGRGGSCNADSGRGLRVHTAGWRSRTGAVVRRSAARPPGLLLSPLRLLILLLVLSLFVAYLASIIVYRLFFSPLASLPGPWYAAISDFWITTHVVRMQQCRTVQALFDKYGPIVRIGPNKVAFCDVGTMRAVYYIHKFDKSSYYKSLLTYVCFISPSRKILSFTVSLQQRKRPCVRVLRLVLR